MKSKLERVEAAIGIHFKARYELARYNERGIKIQKSSRVVKIFIIALHLGHDNDK